MIHCQGRAPSSTLAAGRPRGTTAGGGLRAFSGLVGAAIVACPAARCFVAGLGRRHRPALRRLVSSRGCGLQLRDVGYVGSDMVCFMG